MKVRDLIAKLQMYDQDARVTAYSGSMDREVLDISYNHWTKRMPNGVSTTSTFVRIES